MTKYNRARIIAAEVLFFVLISPLVLLMVAPGPIRDPATSFPRSLAYAFLATLLVFGPGIILGGIVSGIISASSLSLPSGVRMVLWGLTPALFLPIGIGVCLVLQAWGGIPLIGDGGRFVAGAALGGIVIGILQNLVFHRLWKRDSARVSNG